jgi:hypothetical protein
MQGGRMTPAEWVSSIAAGIGALLGGAAWVDSRSQRSDKELEKRDVRTREVVKAELNETDLFVRAAVYDVQVGARDEKFDGLKEEVTKLREYVESDQLPSKIAAAVARYPGARIPIKE